MLGTNINLGQPNITVVSKLRFLFLSHNGLALAVASVKAELGADGQQEDAPGGAAAGNAGAVALAGALGPQQGAKAA